MFFLLVLLSFYRVPFVCLQVFILVEMLFILQVFCFVSITVFLQGTFCLFSGACTFCLFTRVRFGSTAIYFTGVLFGSIAVVENICNLSSSVIGGAIYSETVVFYRGTAYFVMTGFMVFSAMLLL